MKVNPMTGCLDLVGDGGSGSDLEIVTDDGTVIPVSSSINFNGSPRPDLSVIPDSDFGILTYANPNSSENLAIFLTNRRVDEDSVTGATTVDLFTQDLGGTAGCYNFQVYVAGFESTTPAALAYTIFGSIVTTGAAATLIVTQDIISDRQTALLDATVELVVSGNDAILRVTGVAGLTINFKSIATYIFAGAA